MLKFFKKVFGSGQAEDNANGGGHKSPFAPAQNRTNVAVADPVYEGQPSPVAAAPSAPAQQGYAGSTGVRISLHAVIAVLPLELKTRIQQSAVAGVFVTLPLGRVVAQLGSGAVRMSFGELRAACPNVFSPQTDRDNLQIAMPLGEILPQINPAFLPRRQAQRQVEVPDDVHGPFGNDGFGVTFAETRTITGTQITGSPEPLPEPPPVAPPPPPPVAPRAVQPPRPAPLAPPARGIQPPTPTFTPKPAPIAPKPAAPIPAQPVAMKPPQAPIAPRPTPAAPKPPGAPLPPGVPPPSVARNNPPTPPVPFRNPFASTPASPPPGTPPASPPVRPAFPTARGAGATPQPPAAPKLPSAGNGNGNGHVPPAAPIQFNQFQRAPQPQQPPQVPEQPIFQRAPQPQQAPQLPEQPIFQRAPQPQQAPQVPEQPIFQKAPQPQQAPQLPEEPIFQRAPQPQQPSQPQPVPQFQQAPPVAPIPRPVASAPPQPAPVTAPEPAPGNAQEVCLDAPIAVLSESWPEVLRGEIEQLQLSGVNLSLPLRVIEPALKQGKIAFPWKVLRSWIRPAVIQTVSAHDGMMLELPLKVITPLFFARQKEAGAGRQKIELDENIPNLFFGFPQPDSAPTEEAPAAPTGKADGADDVIFSPAQKPAAVPGAPDTNFYVWGDSADTPRVDDTETKKKPSVGTEFLSRYATPNEIVSRAASLDGVLGALVALPDGLMVASKLSSDLNGDTLAAFLPHIFGKVSQCTKELRMGELNNLNFTVGNVPWKIFRVNSIYFAAFGRAGQPLPTAQLAALAAELDRKKQ